MYTSVVRHVVKKCMQLKKKQPSNGWQNIFNFRLQAYKWRAYRLESFFIIHTYTHGDTRKIHRQLHFIPRRWFSRRFISETDFFLRSNLLNDLQQANLAKKSNFRPKIHIHRSLQCVSLYFSVRLLHCLFLRKDNGIKRSLQDNKSSLQLYFSLWTKYLYI